jgi:TPR repeat protein
MNFRSWMAVGLVFCVTASSVGQSAAGAETLFRQASASESAKDLAGAVRLYEQAVQQGHTPSMVRLGILRAFGAGAINNQTAAFGLFTQAANAGNRDGETWLGISYLNGMGTAKNPVAARKWFLDAATAGDQMASYSLGLMLENGQGGERKEFAARRWLDRAASGPDRNLAAQAADVRDKIDKNILSPDLTTAMILTTIGLMAIAGSAMGGDGGSTTATTTGGLGSSGSSSSAHVRTCRQVPNSIGSMTPNGRAASMGGSMGASHPECD